MNKEWNFREEIRKIDFRYYGFDTIDKVFEEFIRRLKDSVTDLEIGFKGHHGMWIRTDVLFIWMKELAGSKLIDSPQPVTSGVKGLNRNQHEDARSQETAADESSSNKDDIKPVGEVCSKKCRGHHPDNCHAHDVYACTECKPKSQACKNCGHKKDWHSYGRLFCNRFYKGDGGSCDCKKFEPHDELPVTICPLEEKEK